MRRLLCILLTLLFSLSGSVMGGNRDFRRCVLAPNSASSLGGWRIAGGVDDFGGYASQFGGGIAGNSVGAATLRQLRGVPDGFRVTLHFDDVPMGLKGQWLKIGGQADEISICALNNSGAAGSASTFVHEARHAIMNSRGTNQLTQRQEYMARAREYLFNSAARPDAAARASIRGDVSRLYPTLPVR
jgi:hypothetical protein